MDLEQKAIERIRLASDLSYDYESKSRPEWCPLKPLSEEKEEEH